MQTWKDVVALLVVIGIIVAIFYPFISIYFSLRSYWGGRRFDALYRAGINPKTGKKIKDM